jgi:hypothetical protein
MCPYLSAIDAPYCFFFLLLHLFLQQPPTVLLTISKRDLFLLINIQGETKITDTFATLTSVQSVVGQLFRTRLKMKNTNIVLSKLIVIILPLPASSSPRKQLLLVLSQGIGNGLSLAAGAAGLDKMRFFIAGVYVRQTVCHKCYIDAQQ